MATAEQFAALVEALRAELASMDANQRAPFFTQPREARPEVFADRRWMLRSVTTGEAKELTGLSPQGFAAYGTQSLDARAAGTLAIQHMPQPTSDDLWEIGALALWRALFPSPAEFTATARALRAELADLPPDQHAPYFTTPRQAEPATLAAVDWATARAIAEDVSRLTRGESGEGGLSAKSIYDYTMVARRAHATGTATPRTMPLPDGHDLWELGALALWRALTSRCGQPWGRWPSHSAYRPQVEALLKVHGSRLSARRLARELGIGQRLAGPLLREAGGGQPKAEDEELVPIVKKFLAEQAEMDRKAGRPPRAVPLQAIRNALAAYGHRVEHARAARILGLAGGKDPRPMTPDTKDGLVRMQTLAAGYGVDPGSITRAWQAGRLTAARQDKVGLLFDPARIKPGPGGLRTPVDIDWEPGKRTAGR